MANNFWLAILLVAYNPRIDVEAVIGCSLRYLDIANGDYTLVGSNSFVRYTCNTGFILYGAKQIVCLSSRWSADPPMCIATTCPKISTTPALRIEEDFDGAVLKFSCNVLHVLKGSDKLICDGKNWSDKAPTCERTHPALSCDFDDGMCDWFQHDKDEQDWQRQTGSTGTSRTGPSHDHTHGADGEGYYVYFETSSPARPGHKAILESPLYPKEYSTYCFSFWYHLYGEKDIGTLEMFIKPDDGHDTLDGLTPMFTLSENKDDVWYQGNFTLQQVERPFQIWVVATKATSYRSDMAIDDVQLAPCEGGFANSTTTVTWKETTSTSHFIAETTQPAKTSTQKTSTPAPTTTASSSASTPVRTTQSTSHQTFPASTRQRMISSTTKITEVSTDHQAASTTRKPKTEPLPYTRQITSEPEVTITNPQNAVHLHQQPISEQNSATTLAYVLIGVGVVIFVCVILVVGFFVYRRKHGRQKDGPSLSSSNPLYCEIDNLEPEPVVNYKGGESPYTSLTY